MIGRGQAARIRPDQASTGRQFNVEVVLWATRSYLMLPISYHDLELMLLSRGVEVDTLRSSTIGVDNLRPQLDFPPAIT
jgi:transposase-like protein